MPVAPRIGRRRRAGLSLLALLSLGACRSGSEIGQVLGGVLGGGGQAQAAQVAGVIAGVDTRSQQIGIQQQANGEAVPVGYDENTRVVYQNQTYPVTALERGDEVVLRVVDRGNGSYYTDSVHVTRSVSSPGGSTAGGGASAVQSMQGIVRQVDRNNGMFSLEVGGGSTVIVSLPYGARSADVDRFRSLRAGESVRLAGVFLNQTRVELRQFY